ncbi:P-loop NTPase fold protein [uncultured Microbacterium sp.]|uniref:KAP family P-loop NTPase fold protein n=1 Tax=uncultured Microbacterium sp. TaxID=191216 RepID=UPI0026040F01|nr:P-loop NTPase fold protein [uncultured Microbacterium sp.]
MADRSNWKILLDTPAASPELGVLATAAALTTVIRQMSPRFSVGIFGGWGSGKTTLMKAIRANLDGLPDLISVDFNAWRFEREPLLLVPLLDCIRTALLSWSNPRDAQSAVRTAAARIGRVVKALASGLSGEVGIPGIASVSYDAGKGLSELGSTSDTDGPKSLYVAAFAELERAYREFRDGGVERVVVFVDDLDRCLPAHALEVLESMKLFFDMEGFILVVGLDESVVERAVISRLATPAESGDSLTPKGGEAVHQQLYVPDEDPPGTAARRRPRVAGHALPLRVARDLRSPPGEPDALRDGAQGLSRRRRSAAQ